MIYTVRQMMFQIVINCGMNKITQLEEFEHDLVTIYNNEYQYNWKYINYNDTNTKLI